MVAFILKSKVVIIQMQVTAYFQISGVYRNQALGAIFLIPKEKILKLAQVSPFKKTQDFHSGRCRVLAIMPCLPQQTNVMR